MMRYVIVLEPLSSLVLAGAELSDSPLGAGSSPGFSQSGQLVGGPPAPPAPIVTSAVKVLTGRSPSGVSGLGSQASPIPSKSASCWLPVGWSLLSWPFGMSGQLSWRFRYPSPSWSVFVPRLSGSSLGSQAASRPSPSASPSLSLLGSPLFGTKGQVSSLFWMPSLSASRCPTVNTVNVYFPAFGVIPRSISPSGTFGFLSQASPMPSPSLSFWSGLATSGQLSAKLSMPSPSWSSFLPVSGLSFGSHWLSRKSKSAS